MEFTRFHTSFFRCRINTEDEKRELILTILGSKHNIYTVEELSGMNINELRKIIDNLFLNIYNRLKNNNTNFPN